MKVSCDERFTDDIKCFSSCSLQYIFYKYLETGKLFVIKYSSKRITKFCEINLMEFRDLFSEMF